MRIHLRLKDWGCWSQFLHWYAPLPVVDHRGGRRRDAYSHAQCCSIPISSPPAAAGTALRGYCTYAPQNPWGAPASVAPSPGRGSPLAEGHAAAWSVGRRNRLGFEPRTCARSDEETGWRLPESLSSRACVDRSGWSLVCCWASGLHLKT